MLIVFFSVRMLTPLPPPAVCAVYCDTVTIHVVRQMQNVNVYKINNGVTRIHRDEMIPEHQMQRLTGEQAELMVEELVKPIKFR